MRYLYVMKDDADGRYMFLTAENEWTYEFETAKCFTPDEAKDEVNARNTPKHQGIYSMYTSGFGKSKP